MGCKPVVLPKVLSDKILVVVVDKDFGLENTNLIGVELKLIALSAHPPTYLVRNPDPARNFFSDDRELGGIQIGWWGTFKPTINKHGAMSVFVPKGDSRYPQGLNVSILLNVKIETPQVVENIYLGVV